MLISVITVCWNAAATIDATCASVDEQTHPEVEHLVIDGQSTDDTLEIVARRPNPGRKVNSEADDGLYDAMNKGLALATGDVVVFLNADDRYCSPTVLAAVHDAFLETSADAVYADIDMVVQSEPVRVQRRWKTGHFSHWKVLLGWQIPHPALFVKRASLQRLGEFNSNYAIAADYDLMLRLVKQPGVRLHYLQRTVVEMAVGGVSTSGLHSTWRGYLESVDVLKPHVGLAAYVVALVKPMWKLPQWLRARSPNRARESRASGGRADDR